MNIATASVEIGAGVPAHCDVASAGCFVSERAMTDGSVEAASAAEERSNTIGRVEDADGQALKPEVALDRIAIGITSVGCRDNRSHCGRKAKADEHEREKETEPQRRAAN